jgi:tRNA nucleotidyltransferase (CCA-adding enzyme)
VAFGVSLDEDLARRDFTINAIAFQPRLGLIHDPFGGQIDLERRVIRAVGDADARMREDRLRALRGLRFAARFEFEIEAGTWRAIVDSAPYLGRLSAERVSQEIEKTMEQVRRPARALRLWKESGALATLVPALAAIDAVTLAALDCLPVPHGKRADQRKWNRISALFWGMRGQAAYQAAMALRFSTSRAKWIAHLAESWHEVGGSRLPASDRDLRRWISIVGRTQFGDFWRIAAARLAAMGEDRSRARAIYRAGLRVAFSNAPLEIGDLALDGNDLIQLGVPKGPRIREILAKMLDAVLENPSLNTTEDLRALIAAWGG